MQYFWGFVPRKARILITYAILKPIGYVFIPGLITAYYQIACLQTSLQEYLPKLHSYAARYDTFNIILAFFVMASIVAIENVSAKLRTVDKTGEDVLTTFIAALDNVVGMKANRFADQAAKISTTDRMRAGDIFKTITEPKLQIIALLQATLNVFHELWPDATFKASLIRVVDGKHFEDPFYKFLPENKSNQLTAKQLEEDERSTASKALKRKMVIVPDFRAELKKKDPSYTTLEERRDEDGSILAYRIDHPKLRIPIFIICICANTKGSITSDHRVTYKWLMDKIEMRIVLEYSLLLLKQEVGG
jgi:hypothetical protein